MQDIRYQCIGHSATAATWLMLQVMKFHIRPAWLRVSAVITFISTIPSAASLLPFSSWFGQAAHLFWVLAIWQILSPYIIEADGIGAHSRDLFLATARADSTCIVISSTRA